MAIESASLTICGRDGSVVSLFRRIGGQPSALVDPLLHALGSNRIISRAAPGLLAVGIVGYSGRDAQKHWEFCNLNHAEDRPHSWRYRISSESYQPTQLVIQRISDAGNTLPYYSGPVDHWLTEAIRKRPRTTTRGPIPRGFASRAEYESYKSRLLQPAGPGEVKEFTAEEYAARRNLKRRRVKPPR
jgi:hypothetical protein